MNALFKVLLLLAATCGAQAQNTPSRPVRIVVPFPAGGPVDTFARQLGQKLSDALGQQFMVDNRAGGNTIIGTDAVAKSAPDGHTLLVTASSFVTTPMLNKAPYDTLKDFSHIAFLARAPLAVVVNPQLPVANIRELIAYGKRNPEKMTFGIGSVGAPAHLGQEVFKRRAGVPMTMVPYKGTTPIFQDLIGGQITGTFEPVLGAMPYIQSNRVRGIAITSLKRIAALPDVPTVHESGVADFEAYTWYGLWGPAGMAAETVKKLNEEVNRALRGNELSERLEKIGFEIQPGSPDRFVQFLREDAHQAAAIIKEANIRAE
jgi:tripartite-type tricarboxylate transporter receptor subunit TctC